MMEKSGGKGFSIGLGLTNECNLACAHCYRDTGRIDRLSLDDVRRVCENVPVGSVNLGTGENGLHPEFHAILEYLRERGTMVALTSNGYTAAVLNDDELRSFADVEFSLDFATEREQDSWRGPGNWRLVLGHVSSLRCQWGGRIAPTRALLAIIPGECLKPETVWRSRMDSNPRYRSLRRFFQRKEADQRMLMKVWAET